MEDEEYKSRYGPGPRQLHPRERASWISSLLFCWMIPLFILGLKKDLSEDDLCGPLKKHRSKTLGAKLKKAWDKKEALHRGSSLRKMMISVYYKELLFFSSFLLVQELIIKMVQPLLIGKIIDFYTPSQSHTSKKQAYGYACGIILCSLTNVIILHCSYFGLEQLSMKMQVACRGLIYRKALNLSKTAMLENTVGQMVNLISNDVSRFHYICLHLHQVVVAPLQTIMVLYLLFVNVDPSAMVGVGLLILFIPFLFYMGKLTSFYRFRTALKTDHRIRLMNEIVSSMKIIKMYTWEKPFTNLIQTARKLELREIKANSYLRNILMSTQKFLIPVSIFLCILTYILTGNTLQAHFVYVVMSYYGQLRQTLTLHVPRCIAMLAEVNVSLKRIQTFLLNEEVTTTTNTLSETTNVGMILKNVYVKWRKSSSDYALSKINVCIRPKDLIAVVGRVGCGKTTLIQTILKEIPISSGELDIRGAISYASQEPWLFSSSIRQNILFGQKMEPTKYKKVVQVCALEEDFANFPYGDRTIVGEKGIMLSGGQKARVSLARAIYKDADIYLLDDPLSAVDVKVGKQIFDQCITGYLKEKCVVLVTHQIQYLNSVSKIYLLENGNIITNGTLAELKNNRNYFRILLHKSEEEMTSNEKINDTSFENERKSISYFEKSNLPKEMKEQRSTGNISKKVYVHYFCLGGSYLFPVLLTVLFIVSQVAASGLDYFLSFWVNLEQKRLEDQLKGNETAHEDYFKYTFFTSNELLYLYASLLAFLTFIILLRTVAFVKFTIKVASNLHNLMYDKISHATLRFFNTNPSGRVLNRFSRDMGIVDESIPPSLAETVQVFFNVIAITIIVSVINPWIILPTFLMFGVFYGFKFIYLATSRNLKRIEGTARSPLFSHLTASLQGLSTIRAFEAQKILQLEFDQIQDHHSSAFYMYMSSSRTFGFWLDINCVIYSAIIIFSFLFIGTETYGGNVGLAITQSTALTMMLQRGIRQWSELENQMTSVERIVEYTELVPEPDERKKEPPKGWPAEGHVKFDNVSIKYFDEGPYVLRNLNWQISAKEKIGIVGRTGAGKSSLISAIFRLACLEGNITIDAVNIKEISLNTLRSAMSIIPQEPVLFSGTLRKNLDPFDEYDDIELWNALEEVELKQLISELTSGLSTKVSEEGSNFSVGERQLLCLARAIVRKRKILILDEATANVDLQTDELIQKTIRRKFQHCTVLTIAHRLQTVMDSDKILVLDNGQLVEFDHPYILLQNSNGLFYSFVEETGKPTAEILKKIAFDSFRNLKLIGMKNEN